MKEKWVVSAKKADFALVAKYFDIDQVVARVMRNRGLTEYEEMRIYLHLSLIHIYTSNDPKPFYRR